MGRSHICQPLRRFAPPPHEWGGACFHAPLPDPLPCGERGIQIGSAPPAASPPPPHKWGGALFPAPRPSTPQRWARRASSKVNRRFAAFDAPNECIALNRLLSSSRSTSTRVVDGAVTVITRPPPIRRSRSRLVSRNGPRWLVANMASQPSALFW